ncbi:hypothetical protein [Streptomyces sp. GSL17-111]|uniref:hypothetical protein n=1 Tax=Streptomyces sp. GSL17-111 TaxID=3121596 RepID=UPI0030F47AD8
MKKTLGLVAVVLVVGGASGLLHEWLGWWRLFGFLRFLEPDGYEVHADVVLIALGLVAGAASERLPS